MDQPHAKATFVRGDVKTEGSRRTVSGSTFHTWFKAALHETNVPDMRFHELRHTAATLAMQTGEASGIDVMARIGHTSPKTAAHYQHVDRQRSRSVATGLSALVAREDPDL